MKKKLKVLAILIILGVIAGLAVLYLGPNLHFASGDELLASCNLSDGSKLFFVQTPNRAISEPYTVRLYHVYPDGRAQAFPVGFEESYWWRATLKPQNHDRVEIHFLGISECTYDIQAKRVSWNDNSYPPQEGHLVDFDWVSNKVMALAPHEWPVTWGRLE